MAPTLALYPWHLQARSTHHPIAACRPRIAPVGSFARAPCGRPRSLADPSSASPQVCVHPPGTGGMLVAVPGARHLCDPVPTRLCMPCPAGQGDAQAHRGLCGRACVGSELVCQTCRPTTTLSVSPTFRTPARPHRHRGARSVNDLQAWPGDGSSDANILLSDPITHRQKFGDHLEVSGFITSGGDVCRDGSLSGDCDIIIDQISRMSTARMPPSFLYHLSRAVRNPLPGAHAFRVLIRACLRFGPSGPGCRRQQTKATTAMTTTFRA